MLHQRQHHLHIQLIKKKFSLKELDFKLRKHLIDKHNLYKTEPKDSKIRITMKDGGLTHLN